MKRKIIIFVFIVYTSIVFGNLVYSSGSSVFISVTSPYKEEYKVEKEEDKLDEEIIKSKYVENEEEEKNFIMEVEKDNYSIKDKEYNNTNLKNSNSWKFEYLSILNFILIILLFFFNLYIFKTQNKD